MMLKIELINHRRTIYTEEKAKVVAAAWGTEYLSIDYSATILHQVIWKKRMTL